MPKTELGKISFSHFAPLGLFAVGLFIFNCIRSPHLVYRNEHDKAQQLIGQANDCATVAEHEKDNANEKLKALSIPELIGTVEGMPVMAAPADSKGSDSLVTVLAMIKKSGSSKHRN